jgi:hypothetical protein
MKRLLIVAALALSSCMTLSSCAPLLSALQGDDATLIRAGGVVTFTAGSTLAQDVGVYLTGAALNVSTPGCHVVGNGVGCKLGDVPPNHPVTLSISGTVTGSATYYRPGSDRPFITTLKGE